MARAAAYTVGFFFLAPGTTAGLVPWWITDWHRPDGPVGVLDVLGVALGVTGLLAVIACFVRFVAEGAGTPAPSAPTESLVVGGLYRHVRNPMYLAVAAMIGGQALVFRSPGVGLWLMAFLAAVLRVRQGLRGAGARASVRHVVPGLSSGCAGVVAAAHAVRRLISAAAGSVRRWSA